MWREVWLKLARVREQKMCERETVVSRVLVGQHESEAASGDVILSLPEKTPCEEMCALPRTQLALHLPSTLLAVQTGLAPCPTWLQAQTSSKIPKLSEPTGPCHTFWLFKHFDAIFQHLLVVQTALVAFRMSSRHLLSSCSVFQASLVVTITTRPHWKKSSTVVPSVIAALRQKRLLKWFSSTKTTRICWFLLIKLSCLRYSVLFLKSTRA